MGKWFTVLMCLILCLGMCILPGCVEETEVSAPVSNMPLIVGVDMFGGNYSPFFATAESDRGIVELTQLKLLDTDRSGKVICNGIDGETTEYNGTEYTYTGPANVSVTEHKNGSVEYVFTLRDDITFSDGTALTAKDVVFSMYVLCDPSYTGPSSFASLPIKGLEDYRRNIVPKWQLILEATPANATVGSSEGYYTAAEALEFWTAFNEVGAAFATEIVDDGIARGIGTDVRSVAEALGYIGLPEAATATDLFNAIVDTRGYTLSATGINASAAKNDFSTLLMEKLSNSLKKGVVTGNSAPRISGIRLTGDHTLSVTLTQPDATALQQFCIPIAPLHYYGNTQLFTPESGSFGFTKGDLSGVRSKSGKPLGAGPYVYKKYSGRVITLSANATYYRGAPKTAEIRCKAISESSKTTLVSTGELHLAEVDMTPQFVETVGKTNGGVLSGDVITVEIVDEMGYGYIGMAADRIRVEGSSGSTASRNLRKALATVFSVYREELVQEYYGEYGTVANDLLEQSSQPVYNVYENGDPIALGGSADGNRYAKAVAAALGYFEAAGYTVKDDRVVAAPEGGSMRFEIGFVMNGSEKQPALGLLTKAKEALADIGITLVLKEYAYEALLLKDISAGIVEMWCGSRELAAVPDLYAYYAQNGGEVAKLDIDDEALEELLVSARREKDESKREQLYAQIYEQVLDWGVEVPLYRKQAVTVTNTSAVNIDTLPADMTPYYDWMDTAETIQMN